MHVFIFIRVIYSRRYSVQCTTLLAKLHEHIWDRLVPVTSSLDRTADRGGDGVLLAARPAWCGKSFTES